MGKGESVPDVVGSGWGVTEVMSDGEGVQDIIPDVVGNGEDVNKMLNNIFSSSSRSSLCQSKEGVGVGFMIVYSHWAWGRCFLTCSHWLTWQDDIHWT